MNQALKGLSVIFLFASAFMAGCTDRGETPQNPWAGTAEPVASVDIEALLIGTLQSGVSPMVFEESVVHAAVSAINGLDLYEPTIDVSDTGVIYVTGHTTLVDTTGAPVFFSRDDGATWAQLPFFQGLTMPEPFHGATPPITDEIFLVAGDDGWLYGVDITAGTYPVNAWSGDGAQHAYYNPNAYDETQVAAQAEDCTAKPTKDRPWAAYAGGRLLMVNNPTGGSAQIGVMNVPPSMPLGPGGAGSGITWNLCTGPMSSMPGIPDMREDGLFAVPQRFSNIMDSPTTLHLILGNSADVMNTRTVDLFEFTTAGEITSVFGHAVFDAEGTLFVGITNNTATKVTNEDPIDRLIWGDSIDGSSGGFILVASTDGGETFQQRNFTMDRPLRHFYMDANEGGAGGLVVWAVDGQTEGGYDWYSAHVRTGPDGAPSLENVYRVIDEGPMPSAHVTGAAVGPDGRAYLAMYDSAFEGLVNDPTLATHTPTPISVYIQRDGPVLPVSQAPGDTSVSVA